MNLVTSLNADLMTVDFMSQVQLLNGTKLAPYSEASCTGNTVILHLHVQLPTDFPINVITNIATLPSGFSPRSAKFPTVIQYTDEWSISNSAICYGYLGGLVGLQVSVPDKNTKWLDISTAYFRRV